MNEDKYKLAVKRYIEGESCKNICKDLKMSTKTLSHILRLKNIKIRGKSSTTTIYSNKDINEIIKLHTKKQSIRDISKKLNLNRQDISYIIKSQGIKVRNRKNKVDESVFEEIDTEEKAYWLGFLYADGNVSKNGRYIDLTLKESDKDHLINFRKFLKSDAKLILKKTTIKKEVISYKLIVCSVKINKDLVDLGCIPTKSLILKFPQKEIINEKLQKHFIRGYFDGDGCVHIDNNHNILFQLCGTEHFLTNTKDILKLDSKIKKTGKVYDLRCKGNIKAMKVLDYLYEDANIYLKRKYNIYLNHKKHYQYCRHNSIPLKSYDYERE